MTHVLVFLYSIKRLEYSISESGDSDFEMDFDLEGFDDNFEDDFEYDISGMFSFVVSKLIGILWFENIYLPSYLSIFFFFNWKRHFCTQGQNKFFFHLCSQQK